MLVKLIKFIVGVLLLPVCYALTQSLVYFLFILSNTATSSPLSPESTGFLIGSALWIVLFIALPHPVKTYVFAHEITHAIWGMAAGGRVKGLKVGDTGGTVLLTKSNFLVVLAPYFFPLYSVAVLVTYAVASAFFDLGAYSPFWMGMLGLTWSFHVTFTMRMLNEHQSDIASQGRLFSYTLIYIVNIFIVILIMIAMGTPTFRFFLTYFTNKLIDVFHLIEEFALYFYTRIGNYLQ